MMGVWDGGERDGGWKGVGDGGWEEGCGGWSVKKKIQE